MENEKVGALITVTGRVQGVWFRDFTRRRASRLGLTGWVANRPDGSVYLEVEGGKVEVEALIRKLHIGPNFARVDQVQVNWCPYEERFHSFKIRY